MPHHAAPTAPVCMNTQHDLLGHGPGRQEHSRRFPQQVGHLRLKFLDDPALPVSIRSGVARNLSQKLARRAVPMAVHEPAATGAQLLDPGPDLVLAGSHQLQARRRLRMQPLWSR